MSKLTDFRPQKKNANRHTPYGLRLMEQSIQRDGFIDAQTAAADGEIISGSARLELEGEKFSDVEPIIVESDGTRPIIVKRTDIPNAESARARRLSVAANQIAKADYNPDWALLKEWNGEDAQIERMFSDMEWTERALGENYYKKEWEGMPEFELVNDKYRSIIVHFENENAVKDFENIMGQSISEKTKSIWIRRKKKAN